MRLAVPTSHSGNPAAAADDADVTTQWQETEELACSLCASAVQSPESPGVSGNHSASHTSLPGDTLTLQPGLNMVTFRVLPLKRGLYTLKHMQGSLGSLSLHIPVMLKEPNALALHSQAAAERPSNAPIAAPDTHNPQAAALGFSPEHRRPSPGDCGPERALLQAAPGSQCCSPEGRPCCWPASVAGCCHHAPA